MKMILGAPGRNENQTEGGRIPEDTGEGDEVI